MARVKGPLMSLEASGTVSKTIVYSNWKGLDYVRQHVIPLNPRTDEQKNIRKAFSLLVEYWHGLNEGQKTQWHEARPRKTISGFNYFMLKGMKEYIKQLGPNVEPTGVEYSGTPPNETWTWHS